MSELLLLMDKVIHKIIISKQSIITAHFGKVDMKSIGILFHSSSLLGHATNGLSQSNIRKVQPSVHS